MAVTGQHQIDTACFKYRQGVLTHVNYVEGATVFGSLDEALRDLQDRADEVFICGGAQIYRQAMDRVDRLYMTIIHQDFEGDTHFPDLPDDQFAEAQRQSFDKPMPFSFVVLDRR